MRATIKTLLTTVLCVLVAVTMLTSGAIVSNNEIREGNPIPIVPNSQPGPGIPHIGPDPVLQWLSFPSPDSSSNFNFIEIADIDIDGKKDIVVGELAGGILVWTGDGNGGWTVFPSPSGSIIANDAVAGDINNDGKPDLVVASATGLAAWTGDGLGGWTMADTGLPTGIFNSVVLEHIDLDGNPDIVAGCSALPAEKGVQVMLGDGAGNWVHGDTNIPTGFTSNSVATGDFNGDGMLDIVAARSDGVSAWIGDGTGSWTLRENGLPGSNIYSDIEFTDFNLDGDLDVVATNGNNGGVGVWNGNGWGTWTMTFNLPFMGTFYAVEVGDANIDGYPDILTGPSGSNESIWSGDGQDDWYLQTGGLSSGITYTDIAVADINNDGRLDYLGTDGAIGIEIWTGDVKRCVNTWEVFNPPPSTSDIMDVETFDVNLDGKLDICFATDFDGIEIWTGDGAGNWNAFNSPVTNGRYRCVESVDFNRDGFPDLVATSAPGIKAWIGDGAGSWTLRNNGLPSGGAYAGLTIADFNDDGNMDIAAGSRSNAGVAVWNGNGWGTWTMTFNLPFDGSYERLDHGDINSDGKVDLLAVNGTLEVFLGDGMDGWTESISGLPTAISTYIDAKFLDLNGDHNLDIVATSETGGAETWLGLGDGTWTYNDQPWTENGLGLAVGDFSIDGVVDIVVGSNYPAQGIASLRQDAIGWTNTSSGLPLGGQYETMELVDINVDGRMDIITRNGDNTGARIWTGTYVTPPLMPPSNIEAIISGAASEDILLNWTLSLTDEDVSEYKIYRSTTFDPTGSGYTLWDSTGHGMSGYVDSGAGKGDFNNYFYIIGATNEVGEWTNATTQVAKINRQVDAGWNLISTPVVVSDTSI
ncbi:MAG: VCBS repeat-containing protein, partial [Thermoplasmata archaeon]|nr:VCBS repeat-containing protein [Thermoplasmata archaeon]